MGLHKDYERDNHPISDFNPDEDLTELAHKKHVRRKLEARLERKRLKLELEDYEGELDDEFDWDTMDR